MKPLLAVGIVAALVAIGPVRADLVYFAKGGRAQLPAEVEGETVRLDTPDGPKVFPRSDFRAIVPGQSPELESEGWADLLNRSGTPEKSFETAWWALENGLTDLAVETLEVCRSFSNLKSNAGDEVRIDPKTRDQVRRALGRLDALKAPCPVPDLSPLRDRLRPSRFREARGEHVVLLHQGTEAEAKERLALLERVVRTFYLTLAVQGIELPAPRRKLVSVYFADRRDYVRTLQTIGAEAFSNTHGYYHPALQTVFAFDVRSAEDQKAGRRAIANRRRDGVEASELDRRALFLDLDRRAIDLGTAAHETIHQLTVDSGLAPRFDDFPTWLHEGFAAQFEVVRGGRWAGVGRAHDLRMPDWRAIHPAPRLAPLLRDAGLNHGYNRDRYAESWALVYFLRKTRPREFVYFLDLLRTPTPGASAKPSRAVDAFRAAFGDDLDRMEAEWRRYMAEVQTPLEAEEPVERGPDLR